MGADRELTIMITMLCGVIIFYSLNIVIIGIAIAIWSVSLYFLRMMSKVDPIMRIVYVKHIKYKSVYLAKSTLFCKSSRKYK